MGAARLEYAVLRAFGLATAVARHAMFASLMDIGEKMPRSRVLVIGLDGYEATIGDDLMAQGLLPNLRRLRERSACFLLDHGKAKRTGLAWEHVSTGLAPEDSGRWAAVDFDPDTYQTWQMPTAARPFPADLPVRTVVFDTPYFDLAQAPGVRGAVSWGAHDPGTPATSRPAGLNEEIRARFGAYPAGEYIYAFVWQSPEETKQMAAKIVEATELRGKIARWLFAERLPDWDLGAVVVSEFHSAIEALWHGLDARHPLHSLPSAPSAGAAIRDVYLAADAMIGDLVGAFPDVDVVVFSMHGMGPNDSDVASMLLLAETMYRHSFGKPCLRERQWPTNAGGVPLLREDENWSDAMRALIELPELPPTPLAMRIRRRLRRRAQLSKESVFTVDWMPAARYSPVWPAMRAFALPSFYDGRIRINLNGREAAGKVAVEDYAAVCDELETLLRECRNVITGEPVVREIDRSGGADPMALGRSESDMTIVWNSSPLGLVHPVLGQIGPVPYRRTGGHSGRYGMAYIATDGVVPGERGIASSFDVVPTVIDLLGERRPPRLSGRSLLDGVAIARESALSAVHA
jgi:predicted AlkP superfamily phosphohydrolase/phosphomutase